MSYLQEHNAPIIDQEFVELFDSLDEMWLHNWQELGETNNLKWLIRHDFQRNRFVDIKRLDDAFLKLMDEWFELTKANSNREELYVLMKKCISARNKVINGDKFQMNLVNKYEQMMKDLLDDNVGVDPDKERMKISAAVKMMIDKRTITVKDYMALIEVVIEENSSKTTDNGGE